METKEETSAATDQQSANNGTSNKTVPEADLVALKQSLEAKVKEAEGALDAAKKQVAEATASLSQERAAKTAAEAKVQELTPRIAELEELKTKHTATEAQLAELHTAQLESRRQALITRGIDSEKAKTLDEAAITVLETHLPARKDGVPAAGFDARGSGATDIAGLSARELLRLGVDQQSRQ